MSHRAYRVLGAVVLTVASLAAAQAETWVPIQGNVRLQNGTAVCAMVLANGQYMFSCDGSGSYSLDVPLDSNGQVTLFTFADGFAPFSTTLGPASFPYGVQMQTAAPNSPLISMTRNVECAVGKPNWVQISGTVESYGSQPLCAMVLANGQQMFTCGESQGRYALIVPVNEDGNVTVFGFADRFQPYSDTFLAPKCDLRTATADGVQFSYYIVEEQLGVQPVCKLSMTATNTTDEKKTCSLFVTAYDVSGRYYSQAATTINLPPRITDSSSSIFGNTSFDGCNKIATWELSSGSNFSFGNPVCYAGSF